MKYFLLILNIIVSIFVILLILTQGKGAGLGNAWGGQGELFQTRRGVERFVFRLTIFFILLFLILSLINFLIKK